MMFIIPFLITIIVSILALGKYGKQSSVFVWALVPMWICYLTVAVCDIYHIM